MRWRVLAIVSLGVNVVLAALWLLANRHASPSASGPGTPRDLAAGQSRTNVLIRRQLFSWLEVESQDYPTYIANLRDIGCPEQTVRDIIIADVNALYARRRATEILTPQQQWWRSEPDTNVLQAAADKIRTLEDERHALLSRLLGPRWEAGDIVSLPRPSRPGVIALDGPVLGPLPAETKQALQDISTRSQERLQAYLDALHDSGQNPNPADLAKLRLQTRDELSRVLPPPQLEEFLLRYSQEANSLRADFGQLAFFNPSQDEFRAVFRSTDPIDQQLQLLTGNDPNTLLARKNLEDQRENAVKLALGPKRYEEYVNLHDPLYRDAVAAANEAGTPDAVRALYQVNLAAAAEQNDIAANTNLTADQRKIELKRLELEQLQANTVATGQPLPPEPPAPPQTPARPPYVVQPGDTLQLVAIKYGVPIEAIRDANPGVNVNRLRPGDPLNIPRNPVAPLPPP